MIKYKKILVSFMLAIQFFTNSSFIVLAQRPAPVISETPAAIAVPENNQITASPSPSETITPTPGLFDEPTETLTPSPTITPVPTLPPVFTPTLIPSLVPSATAILNSDSLTQNSAVMKKPIKSALLSKYFLSGKESLSVKISNVSFNELKTEILKKNIPVNLTVTEKITDDVAILTVDPPNAFPPGKYTIKITDSTGHIESQDFVWGVLAINASKSLYQPGENANLSFAVLDENGMMDCQAKLNLKITNDSLQTSEILSTNNGKIRVTDSCKSKVTSNIADFISSYKLSQSGTYLLELTANTKNGSYTVSDSITVTENNPFIIERDNFPTRINPANKSEVSFNLKATEDFTGQVFEAVPDVFQIASTSATPFQSLQTGVNSKDGLLTGANLPLIIGMPFTGTYPISLKFGEHLLDSLEKDIYQRFGLLGHDGVDYALPEGTPLQAVDDGEIVQAGAGAYGVTVVIEHSWGKSYYGHLQSTGMNLGDKVLKGDKIGISGKTGLATGPHLHFGIKLNNPDMKNGYYGKTDPLPYLEGSSIIPGLGVKLIGWEVNLKKGETKKLSYVFDAPDTSPQFYKLGPIRIYKNQNDIQYTEEGNPFILGISVFKNSKPDYIDTRQWQIAVDAPQIQPDQSGKSGIDNTNLKPEKSIIHKGKIVDTTLKENAKALKRQNGENTAAADDEKLFRWTVDLPNKTVFSFGRQEKSEIIPAVNVRNKEGWFIEYAPYIPDLNGVKPKVNGNSIEWNISEGILARYTALKDRVKADYVVNDRNSLDQLNLPSGEIGNRLTFKFDHNNIPLSESLSQGSAATAIASGSGILSPMLMPDGPIQWLKEDNKPAFEHPVPKITDSSGKEFKGTYKLSADSKGVTLISIIIRPDDLDSAVFPITVDPVTIDSATAATSTAYGNARHIVRDAWGNLFVYNNGDSATSDSLYYKNYNSSTWTDAAISDDQIGSMDIDSLGNIHVSFVSAILYYQLITVTRAGDNTVSGVSAGTPFAIDNTSGLVNRPSLIIANKGEGAGKEKVAIAWATNTTSGGTKVGEIRFLQCDLADGCDTSAEWKNASEALNGNTNGLPSTISVTGAADVLFKTSTAHTTHQAVLTQIPGRPARNPTSAKFDNDGSFSDLSNWIDGNTGTNTSAGFNSANDWVYLGDETKFSRFVASVQSANLDSGVSLTIQYCSGVDGSNNCNAWTAVANIVDNTKNTKPFEENGSILFDEPSAWVLGNVNSANNKYWIRFQNSSLTAWLSEVVVTDRHSHDLLILGGDDISDIISGAYVPWDFINQASWENIPGNTTAPAPWRENTLSLGDHPANWSQATNFPLSVTVDYINNAIYFAEYDCNGSACVTTSDVYVSYLKNNLAINSTNRQSTSFPAITEASDINFSIASDQNKIYLFYIKDPGTNGLVYRVCDPTGGGTRDICDNSADWSSETVLDPDTTLSHPNAIVSKAYGDTTAFDVVYTDTTDLDLRYEKLYINSATPFVSNGSTDQANQIDCDSGTDDQLILAEKIGRFTANANCVSSVNSEEHAGIRFQGINLQQGDKVSSAYVDLRVGTRTGSTPVDFTIYGDDTDNSGDFDGITNCTPGSNCSDVDGDPIVNERPKTTSSYVKSINFETREYRFDVTNIVQEIVCRGAPNSQPCLGDLNNTSASPGWAATNSLSLLFISSEGGSSDNSMVIDLTNTGYLPTLQINKGNTSKKYSMGVLRPPTDNSNPTIKSDLDHPLNTEEYKAVNTDDTLYASVSASMIPSASSSASPVFLLKKQNTDNNNTATVSATAIVKSSTGPKTGSGIANYVYDKVWKSIASQDSLPRDLTFSSDGTKMYMTSQTASIIYQYSLSTAWDLSTATYNSVSLDVSARDSAIKETVFKSDGTKMYILGGNNNTVYQYSLSPAWGDISSATYDSVSKHTTEEGIQSGLAFNSAGTKMYIIGTTNDTVYQYSVSSAWDLSSTVTYDSVSLSVSAQEGTPQDITFNSDGTKLYVTGDSSDHAYQYSLSTGFDLSSASYDSFTKNFIPEDTNPQAIAFNSDGSKIYMLGETNDTVYEYTNGRIVYLQVYNSTNGWETIDSDSVTAADTDITLTGTISGADYFSTETPGGSCSGATFTDCWTSFRIYQEAAPEGNQILYLDYFVTTIPSTGPTTDQQMRHGNWFANDVEQYFTF